MSKLVEQTGLGGFSTSEDFGDVDGLGLLETKLTVGIHFKDAGLSEPNEVRLRPCGIGAPAWRAGGDPYFPG